MDEKRYSEGQQVYIKAVVDRVPNGDAVLYRLITPNGSIVWAKEEEIEDAERK